MNDKLKNAIQMGLRCCAVGGAFGIVFLFWTRSWLFPLQAVVAAFVAPFALWWLLVALPNAYRRLWGGVVGGLSGALAHAVFWTLSLLLNGERHQSIIGPVIALSIASLLLFGWITIPLGTAIGVATAGEQSASNRPRSSTTACGRLSSGRSEGKRRHK